MNLNTRKEITTILRDYREWAAMGVPEYNDWGFETTSALCGNMSMHPLCLDSADYMRMAEEFEVMLEETGNGWRYPFNDNSFYKFGGESHARAHHLNEVRMAWVDKMIDMYG